MVLQFTRFEPMTLDYDPMFAAAKRFLDRLEMT